MKCSMRYYTIYGAITMDRPTFEAYLINYINRDKLYNLVGLLGDGKASVERHVHHHPFRLAKEVFGPDNVITFEKIRESI